MNRLTPHFTLDEFASHDGVPVPTSCLNELQRLCEEFLEPLRGEFGATRVLSGYRSAAHNKAVGGAPRSYHLCLARRRGQAADVSCARGTPRDWFRFVDELGPCGLHAYASWLHVDSRPHDARW